MSISAYEYAGGLAISQDGSLYDWFGVSNAVPVQVAFPPEVTAVYAASKRWAHTLALTNDGLYGWGMNVSGTLGIGSTVDKTALPVKVKFPKAVTAVAHVAASTNHSLAVTNDGLYAWGNNANGQLGISGVSYSLTPTKVPGEDNAIDVAAAEYSSLALH